MKINLADNLSPKILVSNVLSGGVMAVINVALSISLAALIAAGTKPEFFPIFVAVLLFGTAVTSLCGTLGSGFHGIIIAPRSGAAPVLAAMGAAMLVGMGSVNDDVAITTLVVAFALTTLFTGLFLFAIGSLRLGNLVRYIPYPVMGGFFAGIGSVLVKGGAFVATGEAMALDNLSTYMISEVWGLAMPAVVFAICLYWLVSKINHWFVVPGMLLFCIAVFFTILNIGGWSMDGAAANGWLPQLESEASPFPIIKYANMGIVNWQVIAHQFGAILFVAVLNAITLLLDTSGVEILTKKELSPDRELKVAGIANILSGLGGGFSGVHVATDTALTYKLGGDRRLMGFVYFGVVIAAFAAGTGFINFIPTFILGGLLIYIGINFLADWVFKIRNDLPATDYMVVLVILGVIAMVGILEGVAIGIAISIVLFVVNYSRLNLIKNVFYGSDHASNVERSLSVRQILNQEGKRALIIQLQGFVFFGTAANLISAIKDLIINQDHAHKIEFIVLDFHHVNQLDISAIQEFSKLAQFMLKENVNVAVSGYDAQKAGGPGNASFFSAASGVSKWRNFEQIDEAVAWYEEQVLEKLGIVEQDDELNVIDKLGHILTDPAAAAEIFPYLVREEIAADQIIFERDDKGTSMYFIQSGVAAVLLPLKNGRERVVRIYRSGAMIGEMALYTGARRSARVRVQEDTTLYRLDQKCMIELQQNHPKAAGSLHTYIVKMMAERLDRANRELQKVL